MDPGMTPTAAVRVGAGGEQGVAHSEVVIGRLCGAAAEVCRCEHVAVVVLIDGRVALDAATVPTPDLTALGGESLGGPGPRTSTTPSPAGAAVFVVGARSDNEVVESAASVVTTEVSSPQEPAEERVQVLLPR